MTLRAWLLYWFIHVALRAPDHRLVGSRPRLGDWLWLFFFFFFSCRRRHVSHYTLSVCEPRRSEPDTTSLRTLIFRRYYVHLWCSEALSIAYGFGTRQLMLWGFFIFIFALH